MARIRSIHPGIWTDEAFMSLSSFARLLLIGLWTEAYDDGAFEWKPLTLKAKIFPVDNVQIDDLLDEAVAVNLIRKVDMRGKPVGLIRNFCKFQRPKKPNQSGYDLLPYAEYVGATAPNSSTPSEPVRNQFGTSPEKSPQMEDGGGNRSSDATASAADAAGQPDYRQMVWTDGVVSIQRQTGKVEASAKSLVGRWLRDTKDDCRLVLSKIRQAEADRIGDPVSWITAALAAAQGPPPQTEKQRLQEAVLKRMQAAGG